jgi:hypothetical protein
MISPMRAWFGRLAVVAAAVVPFVPAAAEFARRGVPDYLYTGDAATLELRTLYAAHARQLLGPYSPFQWSHPGPAFFYLALPVYELFHQRGPALNLFMLLVNAIAAIAIVLLARRLRGDSFAWLVAALLAVVELVAMPFLQTAEWNPVAPIFPLILLSFLAAALACGAIAVLPAFAFVASAIVQTYIGYWPEVAALCGVVAAVGVWRLASRGEVRFQPQPKDWRIAATTAAVVAFAWSLPLYESATRRPGNLRLLLDFFSAPHPAEHSWAVVFTTVCDGFSVVPAGIAQSWRIAFAPPGPMVADAIALGELALVAGALAAAWRRGDRALGAFAAIALAEMAAAVVAIRTTRGNLLPNLVLWLAVPGLMAVVTGMAWLARPQGRMRTVTVAAGVFALVLALLAPVPRDPVFHDRAIAIEQLARDVEEAVAAHHVVRPVVRVASDHVWPTAAAIVLHLYKRQVPFFVDRTWGFMFGSRLAEDGQPHPSLLIGDGAFADRASEQPTLIPLAHSSDVFVFLDERESATRIGLQRN